MVLGDENHLAVIQDGEGKTMLKLDMEHGEVTINAEKKLILSVGGEDALVIDGMGGKVTISANSLEAEGKQSLQMKSQNMKLEGSMTEIKAQGSLKMNSSGISELKGSMVKIN